MAGRNCAGKGGGNKFGGQNCDTLWHKSNQGRGRRKRRKGRRKMRLPTVEGLSARSWPKASFGSLRAETRGPRLPRAQSCSELHADTLLSAPPGRKPTFGSLRADATLFFKFHCSAYYYPKLLLKIILFKKKLPYRRTQILRPERWQQTT